MPISRKKSCVRCRQSKLRCNQGIPSCSRCSERGALCVYGWNATDAIPYAHADTPRVCRISSTSSRINGESPDHVSRSENPNNISALSASTLIDPQFQTTNFSLDGFELDFTLTNPHAERPFGTSKSGHVPGESTESATFPTCTNVQQFLEIEALGSHAETLDMMTSHGNESGTWSLERTIFPSPTPHAPQTTSVQLPARRGTFQRRNAIRHCLASSVVLGQLTSFPKMMIQGDRLPPFICPPCQMREELAFDCAKNRRHRCLPKDLAICVGLVEMFYSRTPQNADFVWKTIYAEANRLHREHESYDVYQHLAAFQAMTIYALLQALDVETSEANGAQSLLGNVIDISVSAGKRNKVVIDNLYEIPTRQQWVHEESVRRTMIILLIVDLLLEGLLEHQLIRYRSICNAGFDNIPLPASRDLWEAETNFSWRNEYEKYLSQRKANKVLTVADLTELTEGGALKTLLETDPKFDLVPDAFAWCEGLDSLGSLLWMVIPFQQRRTQPGMSEVW